MKNTPKSLTISIVFASLYAVGVIFLAPVSFGIFQVRLADALLPLSMIFGIPSALGLTLGCVVSNVFGGFGIIDIIGGAAANLVACTLAWYLSSKGGIGYRLMGNLFQTLIVTVIVGGYLSLIFLVPFEFGFLGVFIGSVVAINILGFPLQEAIRRIGIFKKISAHS